MMLVRDVVVSVAGRARRDTSGPIVAPSLLSGHYSPEPSGLWRAYLPVSHCITIIYIAEKPFIVNEKRRCRDG